MVTVAQWTDRQPGRETRALLAAIAAGVVSADDELAEACLATWNWLQGMPAAKVPGRSIRKLSVALVQLMYAAMKER